MSVSSALGNYNDDPLRGYNQTLADKQAIGMTKIVKKDRQTMLKKSNWIPKPLTDQNSIFSIDSSIRPRTKQVSRYAQESNIFNLSSVFKPSVKQTKISHLSSNIFSENQTQKGWKPSQKKVQDYKPCCAEEYRDRKVNYSEKMNKSSIFNQQNKDNFMIVKKINLANSRNPIIQGDQSKIFQSKKRVF